MFLVVNQIDISPFQFSMTIQIKTPVYFSGNYFTFCVFVGSIWLTKKKAHFCICISYLYFVFPGLICLEISCQQKCLLGTGRFSSVQFSLVAQLCLTLCNPMNRSAPGLPVHHHLPEFTQSHIHRVGDAIQPSHPLSSPLPPAPNPSQHQSLFQWVNSRSLNFVKYNLTRVVMKNVLFNIIASYYIQCEVKWALESITMNKAIGGDRIPVELFQIMKDDAVKGLHSICQQIWKTQQWPQEWKRSVFIPIPKKGNAKECSNYHAITLISHATKVMLKILQARLQ